MFLIKRERRTFNDILTEYYQEVVNFNEEYNNIYTNILLQEAGVLVEEENTSNSSGGLLSGLMTFIKNIIKKIVDAFAWIIKKLFSPITFVLNKLKATPDDKEVTLKAKPEEAEDKYNKIVKTSAAIASIVGVGALILGKDNVEELQKKLGSAVGLGGSSIGSKIENTFYNGLGRLTFFAGKKVVAREVKSKYSNLTNKAKDIPIVGQNIKKALDKLAGEAKATTESKLLNEYKKVTSWVSVNGGKLVTESGHWLNGVAHMVGF